MLSVSHEVYVLRPCGLGASSLSAMKVDGEDGHDTVYIVSEMLCVLSIRHFVAGK
jgi:hypothetical protein